MTPTQWLCRDRARAPSSCLRKGPWHPDGFQSQFCHQRHLFHAFLEKQKQEQRPKPASLLPCPSVSLAVVWLSILSVCKLGILEGRTLSYRPGFPWEGPGASWRWATGVCVLGCRAVSTPQKLGNEPLPGWRGAGRVTKVDLGFFWADEEGIGVRGGMRVELGVGLSAVSCLRVAPLHPCGGICEWKGQ